MFRYFDDASHAEAFISGAVRFGSLDRYRRIEDPNRRDQTEGHGSVREWREERQAVLLTQGATQVINSPGYVERDSEIGNPVFILCFTRPPLERSKHGHFPVEILEPNRFLSDVRSSLDDNCPWQRNATLVYWDVDYDKGEVVASDSRDSLRLAAAQKPHRFADERETRLVLISHNMVVRDSDGHAPIPDYLTVRVTASLEQYIRRHY